MSELDPFPREAFGSLIARLPAYARLAWRLGREPLLSRARKAAVVAAAGYLALPIDAVPGVIPVLGQLDDIAVAIAAIRFALAGLDPDRRRVHLEAVGLAEADLGTDLRSAGSIAAWTLRAGGRTAARAGRLGARAALTGAKTATRAAPLLRRGAQVAGRGLDLAARGAGFASRGVDGAAEGAASAGRKVRRGIDAAGRAGASVRSRLPSRTSTDVDEEPTKPS